jgi:hypothetical protein
VDRKIGRATQQNEAQVSKLDSLKTMLHCHVDFDYFAKLLLYTYIRYLIIKPTVVAEMQSSRSLDQLHNLDMQRVKVVPC